MSGAGAIPARLPKLFITHGWLDVSATFQPLVEPLLERWQVLLPDWRGFGYSEWPQDGYWFYDYVADLEGVLDHYSPQEPVLLVGHSMCAQVAALYAGLRPQRVRKLVCLDGIGLPDAPLQRAPARVRKWLDQVREPLPVKSYDSFEQLGGRVRRQHPQLSEEQALFVARCWGQQDGRGRIRLCADPKHTPRRPAAVPRRRGRGNLAPDHRADPVHRRRQVADGLAGGGAGAPARIFRRPAGGGDRERRAYAALRCAA